MKRRMIPIVAAFLLLLLRGPASAQCSDCSFTIGVDENGNGDLLFAGLLLSPLPGALAPDDPLGPGGPDPALTYAIPIPFLPVVPGDVLLADARFGGAVEDVLRFNPDGTLVFYSDAAGGNGSLADTGLPTTLYSNTLTLPEIGNAALDGAFYSPGPNDPGFSSGFPLNYLFVSDGSLDDALANGFVPEPGAMALLLVMGFGGVRLLVKRRRR